MARPSIAIALPRDERGPVADALRAADLDPIVVRRPDELEAQLVAGRDIALAILDGETDFDTSLEYYSLLHEGGRDIPALMVLSARALERVGSAPRRGARRVLHPALLAGVDPLARRGDDDPPPRRRRRQRRGHPDRAPEPRRLVTATGPSSRSSTRRAASARRPWRSTSPRPCTADGPPRPPRGRRHGHRPHRQLARPGARPHPGRRGDRRARGAGAAARHPRRPAVGPPVRDARAGPGLEPPEDLRSSTRPTSPRRSTPDGACTTSSSWTCIPTTSRSIGPSSSGRTGSSSR